MESSYFAGPGSIKKIFYPRIGHALLLMLLVILVNLFISVILSMSAGELYNQKLNYFLALGNTISFGLIIALGIKRSDEKIREIFPMKKISALMLFSILITCTGLTVIISELDNLLQAVLPMPEFIYKLFYGLYAADDILGSVLALAIVAPLTEEFFFRGLILNGFSKNYTAAKAIIISSILFGAIHLNPWQFSGAFLIGIYFAILLIKTGSLLPGVIGHAIFNGLPILIMKFTSLKIVGYTERGEMPTLQPLWFDAIGASLLLTGILLTYLSIKRK